MTIENFLKQNVGVCIEFEGRWLVWNGEEWVVREQPYRARSSVVLYRGDTLESALKMLAGTP